MTDILIDARRGAGSSLEILYGTVTWKPTLTHSRGTSIVLPAPTTYDLVDGQVVATNVQPTPEPVAGQIEWAYEVTFKDRHGKSYSFLVGVPDSTSQVNFTALPRYFETKPPLFGQGPAGPSGEAATVDVGTVSGGTEASVTNSGTSTDAVLDFVLPEGPQGPPGNGVNFEYRGKIFSDPPSAYPNGLHEGLFEATAGGWPRPSGAVFVSVTTFKHSGFPAASFQLISGYQEAAMPLFRKALTGESWGELKTLASSDLATTTANGLMSSADKSKLDNVGVLSFNTKTPSNAPSTYPEGTTVGLMAVSGGWPEIEGNISGSVIVRTDRPKGYNSATQWVSGHKTSDVSLNPSASVMYREGATTGTWGEWQSLATQSVARRISGVINATDYPTVQQAIDEAFTSKKPLLVDTDVVATSVDYKLYRLQIEGKGSITVGGNKFWVNPQHQGIQTNRIYLNPTSGNDSNSGIDPSAPVKTFTQLNINLTMLRERLLDGFWEIIIQAGTHMVDAGWRMNGLRTKWPLIIKGEGTLATILDGTNDTLGKAFYFKQLDTSVTFQNLHIRNYIGGSSAGAAGDIDTSAGIICQGPGLLRVENCRVQNCSTGISGGYGATVQIYGCTIEGNLPRSIDSSMNVGIVILYGASGTVGTFNWKNTFKNITNAVHVTRNAVAHVDYNDITDCYYGLQASHNARAAVLDGVFHRNMVGINMTGGAECTYATADFGTGANVNILQNVRFSGTAKFTQYQGAHPSATEFRLYEQTNVPPLEAPTGTTELSLINNYPSSASIPANTLHGLNKRIRFKIHGLMGGTGYRTIQVRKSNRSGLLPTFLNDIIAPAGYTGNFTLEIEVNKSHVGGNFRVASTLIVDGKPPVIRHGYISGVDISHDWLFRLYKTDNTSDNTMSILTQEIYVTG